jgi:hypothetical protein
VKILTLSTYPIATPRHGGQHRLHNIVAAYRAAGHETESVGVLGSITYESEYGFVACPAHDALAPYIAKPLYMEDWAIGQLAARDGAFFAAVCSQIRETPDLIHIEQPWLFEFAVRYAGEISGKAVKLVYGSQNIEYLLKSKIVESCIDKQQAKLCAQLVLECELAAARRADIVCAASAHDAEWLRQQAGCEVVVAGNGVRDRATTNTGINLANLITGHRKSVVYCASAHPPNIAGFFDMFERGVGCLSPDERLVVAGGAGAHIKTDARFQRVPGLGKHYIEAGEVTEECLQGLLHNAHAIILPITQGGGTNLKTAEALWAGRHVVATRMAMRGFEKYTASYGVAVCEDSVAFRHAIRAAMASAPLELTHEERLLRRSLLWESALMPLINSVSNLDP